MTGRGGEWLFFMGSGRNDFVAELTRFETWDQETGIMEDAKVNCDAVDREIEESRFAQDVYSALDDSVE